MKDTLMSRVHDTLERLSDQLPFPTTFHLTCSPDIERELRLRYSAIIPRLPPGQLRQIQTVFGPVHIKVDPTMPDGWLHIKENAH